MLQVMLIDDEEDALNLLEILLQEIGNVQIVGRYSQSFQALEALEKMNVDLIFLDIDMPGLKGTEVARKVKIMFPHIKIVFITAYSEYAVEAFEIQSDDYLLKPFTPERLKLSISRLRNNKVDPPVTKDTFKPIHIQSMGGFFVYSVEEQNRTISWKTNKEKEVCAFLIHHLNKSVDTDVIIDAIWPEHDVKKAKSYLYTCLSYLRKNLKDNGLPATINKVGKGFAFFANGLQSDEEMFRKLLIEITNKEDIDNELFNKMNLLYQGEYMEGCGYQWAMTKQLDLKNRYIRALVKVYEYFKHTNITIAEDSLQRIMTLTPDSEKYGRKLIKLYISIGKRNEAMNIYRQIESNVHELGIELEEETIELYKIIAPTKY